MNGDTGDRIPKEVNRILYAHVISNRGPHVPTVDMIAEEMGWSAIRLYKKLEGETSIAVEDFPRLYRACGRPIDALRYLVRRCEPGMYLANRDAGSINGRFDDELAEMHITQGKFYDLMTRSLSDGELDEDEKVQLKALIGKLRPVIDRLDAEIDQHGKPFERGGRNG